MGHLVILGSGEGRGVAFASYYVSHVPDGVVPNDVLLERQLGGCYTASYGRELALRSWQRI